MTFEAWMRKVDEGLKRRAGVGVDDLADYAYRDAFDDGEAPGDVVDAVLEENGWPGDGE